MTDKLRLDWDDITTLVQTVSDQIKASGWQPTVIIALSRGGFVPATMIAYQLDVRSLLGLDVSKDEAGQRSLGRFTKLQDLHAQRVLAVDDSMISGRLLTLTVKAAVADGAEARTCALISVGDKPDPDYYVERFAKMPLLPWE